MGLFDDSSGNRHGFLLSNGAFTTIDVPGATLTVATGINSGGDIVGDYFDSSGNRHAYLLARVLYDHRFPGSRGRLGWMWKDQPARRHRRGSMKTAAVTPWFLLSKGKFTTIDMVGSHSDVFV